jgi:hypothetical protein
MIPTVERTSDCAYFVDADGVRYRVHDVAFGPQLAAPGKKCAMPLESIDANHRYFITADGLARAYRFTKKEARTLSADRLQQQLNGAGFVSALPRSIGALKPT